MTFNSTAQVHRLPIYDDQHNKTGNYALLQITPEPERTWPLHLEATEGQTSYHTKVSRHETSSLREKKNQKSKDEWESIVLQCLLRKNVDEHDRTLDTKDLEVFATSAPQEISIIIRKKIGEVKQRLGEIPIRLDEEHEVDVLGWCHSAVERGDTLASEQETLQSKFSDQQATISDLNKRLEDLIAAKKEHESALMAKFCDLINTKKLKIRDQQRLLATVKPDQAEAAKVRESRNSKTEKVPARSRKGKRKATAFADEQSEDDDEEAFGDGKTMKTEAEFDSEEEEGRKTDEGSDIGEVTTDDESDNAGTTAKAQPAIPHRPRDEARNDEQDVTMEDLPPVRDLPFGRKGSKATPAATQAADSGNSRQAAADEDDETTDDDEL